MFRAATDDEATLLKFVLGSGFRDQENVDTKTRSLLVDLILSLRWWFLVSTLVSTEAQN